MSSLDTVHVGELLPKGALSRGAADRLLRGNGPIGGGGGHLLFRRRVSLRQGHPLLELIVLLDGLEDLILAGLLFFIIRFNIRIIVLVFITRILEIRICRDQAERGLIGVLLVSLKPRTTA